MSVTQTESSFSSIADGILRMAISERPLSGPQGMVAKPSKKRYNELTKRERLEKFMEDGIFNPFHMNLLQLPNVRCYTCGTVIANKYLQFLADQMFGMTEANAVISSGLKRYCCKVQLMSPGVYLAPGEPPEGIVSINRQTVANMDEYHRAKSSIVPSIISNGSALTSMNSSRQSSTVPMMMRGAKGFGGIGISASVTHVKPLNAPSMVTQGIVSPTMVTPVMRDPMEVTTSQPFLKPSSQQFLQSSGNISLASTSVITPPSPGMVARSTIVHGGPGEHGGIQLVPGITIKRRKMATSQIQPLTREQQQGSTIRPSFAPFLTPLSAPVPSIPITTGNIIGGASVKGVFDASGGILSESPSTFYEPIIPETSSAMEVEHFQIQQPIPQAGTPVVISARPRPRRRRMQRHPGRVMVQPLTSAQIKTPISLVPITQTQMQ